MKEKETTFELKGQKYKAVFNLNVIQEIQMEYESLSKWGELTDGKNGEVNIKALIFGIKAMLNEGIDIDNENTNEKLQFLTEKQVGRIITEIGMENATNKVNEVVINSTKDDKEKNV